MKLAFAVLVVLALACAVSGRRMGEGVNPTHLALRYPVVARHTLDSDFIALLEGQSDDEKDSSEASAQKKNENVTTAECQKGFVCPIIGGLCCLGLTNETTGTVCCPISNPCVKPDDPDDEPLCADSAEDKKLKQMRIDSRAEMYKGAVEEFNTKAKQQKSIEKSKKEIEIAKKKQNSENAEKGQESENKNKRVLKKKHDEEETKHRENTLKKKLINKNELKRREFGMEQREKKSRAQHEASSKTYVKRIEAEKKRLAERKDKQNAARRREQAKKKEQAVKRKKEQYAKSLRPRWRVLSNRACFGARGGFGRFYVRGKHLIYHLRLYWVGGSVSCNRRYYSHWGCHGGSVWMNTVITNNRNRLVLPNGRVRGFRWLHTRGWWYRIYSWRANYRNLSFYTKGGYLITRGSKSGATEYRIWYGEAIRRYTTGDNRGRSCARVYAYGRLYR